MFVFNPRLPKKQCHIITYPNMSIVFRGEKNIIQSFGFSPLTRKVHPLLCFREGEGVDNMARCLLKTPRCCYYLPTYLVFVSFHTWTKVTTRMIHRDCEMKSKHKVGVVAHQVAVMSTWWRNPRWHRHYKGVRSSVRSASLIGWTSYACLREES